MQLLGDPNFYKACPGYFFMRATALATYERWQRAVVGVREDCDGCNDKGIYKPVVKTFADHTVRMYQEDPALLEPLVKYLTKRMKGKRPKPILLYYRGPNGGVANISF